MSRAGSCAGGASANVVGTLILLAPAIGGAYWFWSTAKDGHSPSIVAWIFVGIDLVALGALVGIAISKLLRMGEERASTFQGLLVLVVLIGGILYARSWAHAQQGGLAKALGPACLGHGVAQAAEAGAKGPLRIVVLDKNGHRTGWTYADADWRAKKVGEAALVACVNRQDVLLETQSYRSVRNPASTHELSRYADVVRVRIVNARTGEMIDRFELRNEPRELRETESEDQDDLHGEVEFDELSSRMSRYADGV